MNREFWWLKIVPFPKSLKHSTKLDNKIIILNKIFYFGYFNDHIPLMDELSIIEDDSVRITREIICPALINLFIWLIILFKLNLAIIYMFLTSVPFNTIFLTVSAISPYSQSYYFWYRSNIPLLLFHTATVHCLIQFVISLNWMRGRWSLFLPKAESCKGWHL